MNTREIRMQHYVRMQNLEAEVYDKGRINDNVMEYPFLTDRANYRPLGQKWRPFFIMPQYSRRTDWEWTAGYSRLAARVLLAVVCLGAGYAIGR